MDDQIAATIEEAEDGRVNFSANLTSVIESFDATEFTVEADYGQYSDSTSFILSTYKLPVLETTLLVDEVNENMNETLRFIDCAINGKFLTYTTKLIEQYLYSEAGYKPKELDFGSVTEHVVIKIGDVELMAEPDVNGTNYSANLTPDDLKLASPISSLNGAYASCEFSYSFVSLFMYIYHDSSGQ